MITAKRNTIFFLADTMQIFPFSSMQIYIMNTQIAKSISICLKSSIFQPGHHRL